MPPHKWSKPLAVYDNVGGFKCRGCGALVCGSEEKPDEGDLEFHGLPLECGDEARVIVIHDAYKAWDEVTWTYEDKYKYEWEDGE